MKIIYKYPIRLFRHIIVLPRKAKVLKIDTQQPNQYFLWALVDLDQELVNTEVLCLGTGCQAPDNIDEFDYINTLQKDDFVWHFFVQQHE